MYQPLHIALETPTSWVFEPHQITHPLGYIITGSCSGRIQRLFVQTPQHPQCVLLEFVSRKSQTLGDVFFEVSSHIASKNTQALYEKVQKALLLHGPEHQWTVHWTPQTVQASSTGPGKMHLYLKDRMKSVLGDALHAQILQHSLLWIPQHPQRLELERNIFYFTLPKTAHERLMLLAKPTADLCLAKEA